MLIGMGNAIGAGTFGKMSSAICLGLWYTTGSMAASATYVVGVMLATAYAVWSGSLRESNVVTV